MHRRSILAPVPIQQRALPAPLEQWVPRDQAIVFEDADLVRQAVDLDHAASYAALCGFPRKDVVERVAKPYAGLDIQDRDEYALALGGVPREQLLARGGERGHRRRSGGRWARSRPVARAPPTCG